MREMISATETNRPPALRRSLREDYLYATDLPQTAAEDAVDAFCQRANKAGWRTEKNGGWIQLDPPAALLREKVFPGPCGREAKACASLLRRHPSGRRSGQREIRLLIKAGEESANAFEKACEALHREWAAALRNREGLPEIPDEIFGEEQIQ